MDADIKDLQERFKFVIELEPADERVQFMRFEDGRAYRLQHPGAMAVAKIFGSDTNKLTFDCLEFFINNCIMPVVGSTAKKLTSETLDINETLDLWMAFAWRWLRHGFRLFID